LGFGPDGAWTVFVLYADRRIDGWSFGLSERLLFFLFFLLIVRLNIDFFTNIISDKCLIIDSVNVISDTVDEATTGK